MEYNKDIFKPYYDSYMNDLFGLLRIPSVLDKFDKDNKECPFGRPIRDALDYMFDLAKRDGFSYTNVDNYSGFIEYGEGTKVLLILCHLDVVPATGKWNNPPFDPIIKDGRVYARGVSDDKGPLMITYYTLKMLKDMGYKPQMKIRFFFGCDEENASRGLEKYIEKYGECDLGFSPDADYPCIYAEKGISSERIDGSVDDSEIVLFKSGTVHNVVPDEATCTLKTLNLEKEFYEYLKENNLKGEYFNNTYKVYGLSMHGSTPEYGVNAALYLANFLSKYIDNNFTRLCGKTLFKDYFGDNLGIGYTDDEMGKVSNNAAIFNLENRKYSVVMNIRYPKGFEFIKMMDILKENISKYNATLTVLSNSEYHYVPKYSHLVQALLKAYRDITHDESEPISIGGGTYARDFKNAVAFGCLFKGEESSMHMPNESMSIDSMIKSVFIILNAIKNLCD